MGVAYEERAAGVLTTSLVAEGTSSRVTVGSTTNVAHILSTNDDDAVLVLTGTPGSGNALGALGKNDSLWTNGGTPMTFVNAGQNTNDNIEASAPALQTFHDVIESFKDGDHLFVFGFNHPAANPILPPPGVNIGPNLAGDAMLSIDFAGGNAFTADVTFKGVSPAQLLLTHHVLTGTLNGAPYLEVT